jgi:hypothetical protein
LRPDPSAEALRYFLSVRFADVSKKNFCSKQQMSLVVGLGMRPCRSTWRKGYTSETEA